MEWSEVPVGTLTDSDIQGLATNSLLFTREFDPERVRQACYELRASEIFYDVASDSEDRRRVVDSNGYLLRPHTFVTAVVMERIALPADVLARILTKGQLLSVGILPVNTYADPGFEGRLGITLCNISHRHIVVRPGQPIAKIEFSKLPKEVSAPYSGQHGYETEIWPLPVHHYADTDSDWFQQQTGTRRSEIAAIHGDLVAQMSDRLEWYARRVWVQIIVVMAFLAVASLLRDQLSLFWSLAVGIAANLATQFAWPQLSKIRRSRSKT